MPDSLNFAWCNVKKFFGISLDPYWVNMKKSP
jgi:hypothetical protein